ncbi:MAG: LysR family transcriptional regulator [Pseudomonadota bacterium]
MDRFHEMRVFVAVADAKSFSKAARALDVSAPAVSRAVTALEARVGARLVNRTTRSIRLTEAGERFASDCRRILVQVEAAERQAVGAAQPPAGRLRVAAAVAVGRLLMPPILTGFVQAHPQLCVSTLFVDRSVDMLEEPADVGVRIGDAPEPDLIVRQLGAVRRVIVASPGYLARRGEPASLADLEEKEVVEATGGAINDAPAVLADADGPQPRARLEVNDICAALAAVQSGEGGVTSALCYVVGDLVREGRLKPILRAFWSAPAPVSLVVSRAMSSEPKVRAFLDYAGPRLAAEFARRSGALRDAPPDPPGATCAGDDAADARA